MEPKPLHKSLFVLVLVLLCAGAAAAAGLSHEQLAAIRQVGDVRISPDGALVAYTLVIPRELGRKNDGRAWSELHVVPTSGGPSRTYIGGEVNLSDIRFSPDGELIFYRAKRGEDKHAALWAIPVGGGESRKLLEYETGIGSYRISPDGKRVAFLATPPELKERKQAKEQGYTQEVFEEDWRHRRVWLAQLPPFTPDAAVPGEEASEGLEPAALEIDDGSVFALAWAPDGERLALAVAPRPLIDDGYMFKRVRVVSAASGETLAEIGNTGKLGAFEFSPDGKRLAMISAADPNDPRDGRLLIAPSTGGELTDLFPGLEAHVSAFAWKDSRSLAVVIDEGEETRLAVADAASGAVDSRLVSGSGKPVVQGIRLSGNGKRAAFVGHTPEHPREAYALDGEGLRRLTTSNPWLGDVEMARQEVISYKARDGLGLRGVLIHPLDGRKSAPLILMVHGGPEGHDRNGWVTSYSRPGQIAAAQGFAVFYPNYRGSTGRGVAFSKLSQGDAAGKEFDDLVDAVDHLVEAGIADGDRVGITGGSYGGYATAWCSTRYTDRFKAGVMFVGISNKLSKGFTTEIPIEDVMVHTRFDAWTKWQFTLERSPLYHAEKSRTALLIAHGTADPRVHPSQSLQLYRALKLMGHTPVRYVRYPGEGHGNRRAAARDDYSRRLLRWMTHFLVDGATELPPWDLRLGVEPEKEEEGDDES